MILHMMDRYIEEVQSGELPACLYVRQAVDRHVSDLEKSKNANYPYRFDRTLANRVLQIVKMMRHTQGQHQGKLFQITPAQAFIVGCIYGWVKKADGRRRFIKAYVEVPRKFGKSELCAALECYSLLFDGEGGAQVYTAATKRDQCDYVFNAAKYMLKKLMEDFPELQGMVKVQRTEIVVPDTNSVLKKLSADSHKEDGANPSFATIDEYHAHPSDSLLKVIETGTVSRPQPLVFIITTAGYNKHGACYNQRKTVGNILNGTIENERLFGIIYTMDRDDDWEDEATWYKANPNLGITPTLDGIRDAYVKAKTEGESAKMEFLTKNLNVWTDAPDFWILNEDWKACGDPAIKLEDYWGKKIAIGLDLSSDSDLTCAHVVVYPQDGVEQPVYIPLFYCPATKVSENKRVDGVDYRAWVKHGHITMTPGNVIDYGYIFNDICSLAVKHKITVVEYDPHNSNDLIPKLDAEGIYCNPHRQGPVSMNLPVKAIKRMVLNHPDNRKKIDEELAELVADTTMDDEMYLLHDDNPVMAWMMGNVEIHYDSNGNQKITKNSVKGGGKKKSNNKVDGPVAMAMATTALIIPPEDNESVYNHKDLLVL